MSILAVVISLLWLFLGYTITSYIGYWIVKMSMKNIPSYKDITILERISLSILCIAVIAIIVIPLVIMIPIVYEILTNKIKI